MIARIIYRAAGTVVWQLADGYVMWRPGGRLLFSLADPRRPGSAYPTPVEHPTADGVYRTLREAAAAVERFASFGASGSCSRTRTRRCAGCGTRMSRETRTTVPVRRVGRGWGARTWRDGHAVEGFGKTMKGAVRAALGAA